MKFCGRRGEVTLRHANALQLTADHPGAMASVSAATAEKLALNGQASVSVVNGAGSVVLPLSIDARVPDNCVYIPAGHAASAEIGAYGTIRLSAATGEGA